jgi:hypothetical protein
MIVPGQYSMSQLVRNLDIVGSIYNKEDHILEYFVLSYVVALNPLSLFL